jgi:hypothetical protein
MQENQEVLKLSGEVLIQWENKYRKEKDGSSVRG